MSEPKKQVELPPLPLNSLSVAEECVGREWPSDGSYTQYALVCRERQLLSALTESAAKDAGLEAANARIAELESYKFNADHAANLGILEYQALSAKLTAVEEIIAEKLPYVHDADDESYYPTPIVDALFARIREVIK